jgi:cell shape-determining protein MreC
MYLEEALQTIQKQDTEINKLKQENNTLKEQLQMFIPRRRVRRVYKMLGKILRTDIDPVLLEKELKSEERRGEYE